MWSIKNIQTNYLGKIASITDVTKIINDWSLDQVLGDEMMITAGDVDLTYLQPFPAIGWLGFFWDDQLIDCFELTYPEEVDVKRGRCRSRFRSIQSIFYRDLGNEVLAYSGDINSWNYYINNAAAVADLKCKFGFKFQANWSWLVQVSRVVYSLGDLLLGLQGGIDKFYKVLPLAYYPFPLKNQNNLPIIFRGMSVPYGQDVIGWTFTNYSVTWLDLFKLAIFAWNAYLSVTPSIISGGGNQYLALTPRLLPRIKIDPISPKAVQWLELFKLNRQYKLDGVHLYSNIRTAEGDPSFEYRQGALQGKIFERAVDVGDPTVPLEKGDETLYWCVGDYEASTGKYKILDGSGNPRPYFASGLVAPWYADVITGGAGYRGTIIYHGERVGDHVYAGSNVIQINRLTIRKTASGGATAEVEGIVIA